MRILDLSYVGITAIPDIMWEMQNLASLRLNYNKISQLHATNTTCKSLKNLNLKWNRIASLNPSFIPSSVTDLNLEGNPFNCSCQLMSYVIWVKEKKFVKIQNDWLRGRYICAKPRAFKGKSLATFVNRIQPSDCKPFNDYIIAAIVLCLIMVAIVIVTNVVVWWKRKYKKQMNGEEVAPLIT
jgi:hypothetical protein